MQSMDWFIMLMASLPMWPMSQVAELLHGEENNVYADAGYTGVEKCEEHESRELIWQIAVRRSTFPS